MASIFKRKRNGKPYGKWLIAYKDENGARRVIVGGHSKTVAVQLANSFEDEVKMRKRGIINVEDENRSEAEQK